MRQTNPYRLSAIAGLGGILIALTLSVSPDLFELPEGRPGCDIPIHFRLGDVDTRFPLDRRIFLRTALEAEAVWEKALGKDLLVYDPEADFVVTTLFDGRQEMTYDARSLQEELKQYDNRTGDLKGTYEALLAAFRNDRNKLDRTISEFEKDLADYNADVLRENDSGGASPERYEELKERRDELKDRQSAINKESERLEKSAEKINTIAGTINDDTETVNRSLSDYRKKYGEPKPFIQGLYESPLVSITIFQFERTEDLRLVLAHEFGHSLGIEEHVPDDEDSIMYAMMGGQDPENPKPSEADIEAYRAVCQEIPDSERTALVRFLVTAPDDELTPKMILPLLFRWISS